MSVSKKAKYELNAHVIPTGLGPRANQGIVKWTEQSLQYFPSGWGIQQRPIPLSQELLTGKFP